MAFAVGGGDLKDPWAVAFVLQEGQRRQEIAKNCHTGAERC